VKLRAILILLLVARGAAAALAVDSTTGTAGFIQPAITVDTGSPYTAKSSAQFNSLSNTPANGVGHNWIALVATSTPTAGNMTSSSTSGVSGGGLTWFRRQICATVTNSPNLFVAEIWTATGAANGGAITYTPGSAATTGDGIFTLYSLNGAADPAIWNYQCTSNDGGAGSAVAATRNPTRTGSLLFGVGSDFNTSTTRTASANSTKVDEVVGSNIEFTFKLTSTNATYGSVSFGSSAPSSLAWVFANAEVMPANTLSMSFTNTAGKLLLCGVVTGGLMTPVPAPTVGNVFYGSQYMERIPTAVAYWDTSSASTAAAYYLKNPATGSNTLSITVAAGDTLVSIIAGCISFTGHNTLAPIVQAAAATGNSTTPSVALSSTASGNYVADWMGTATAYSSNTQTLMWSKNLVTTSGSGNAASQYASSGGGTVTMSYGVTSGLWGIAAVEVAAAPGAAAAVNASTQGATPLVLRAAGAAQ
jgi:hypothetical protein